MNSSSPYLTPRHTLHLLLRCRHICTPLGKFLLQSGAARGGGVVGRGGVHESRVCRQCMRPSNIDRTSLPDVTFPPPRYIGTGGLGFRGERHIPLLELLKADAHVLLAICALVERASVEWGLTRPRHCCGHRSRQGHHQLQRTMQI